MKRTISFLLACLLVTGMLPAYAHAQETENVVTETTITETVPTEETIPETIAETNPEETEVSETVPVTEETLRVAETEVPAVTEEETAPVLFGTSVDGTDDSFYSPQSISNGYTKSGTVDSTSNFTSAGLVSDQIDYFGFSLYYDAVVTIKVTSQTSLYSVVLWSSSGSQIASGTTIRKELSSGSYVVSIQNRPKVGKNQYYISLDYCTHSNYTSTVLSQATNCQTTGRTQYVCNKCGHKWIESKTGPHSYGNWFVIDATCTKSGLKERCCYICNKCEDVVIPATGHSYDRGVVTKEPTCAEEGVKTTTCTKCGDKIEEAIAMLPHTHGDWIVTKEPTCTEDGEQYKTCSTCADKVVETIPALGHSYGDWEQIKETSCAEAGINARICATCGNQDQEVIQQLDHTYGEWVITEAPACTQKGSKEQVCAVCGYVNQVTLPASHDKWVTIASDYGKVQTYRHTSCTKCSWSEKTYYPKGTPLTSKILEGVHVIESIYYLDEGDRYLVVPEGVISIGKRAFNDETNLITIELPESLVEIGDYAFAYCTNLKSVTIPGNLAKIGEYAFDECASLTKVEMSGNVAEFGKGVFCHCTSLTEIELPQGLSTIPGWTFVGCESLEEIHLPDSITSIERNSFENYESIGGENIDRVYIPSLEAWINIDFSDHPFQNSFSGDLYVGGAELRSCVITDFDYSGAFPFWNCYGVEYRFCYTADDPRGYPISHIIKYSNNGRSVTIVYPKDSPAWTEFIEKTGNTYVTWVACDHSFTGDTCATNRKCTNCGAEVLYTHSYGDATCTTPATCSGCGKVKGEALGHSFTNYIFNNDATCTVNGTKTAKCDRCHVTDTVTDPGTVTGHTVFVLEAKPATCTETGLTEGKQCSVCQTILVKQQKTPVLVHVETAVEGKAATCTEPGLTEGKQCSLCKEILVKQEEVPALGHDYVDRVCTRCGAEKYSITRVSGKDRHDTAFKIANMLKSVLNVEKFDTILIASGSDSADALAGSYLAAMKGAPILLSRNNSHPRNLAYIQENLSENGIVYILGGTGAVPQEMENLLIENGINYERVKGADRFGTNLEILKKAGEIQGNEILVSTAYNFADSLSASATGKPILLVNSKRNVLTNAQKAYLAEITAGGPKTFTIIGGTGAVADELATALSAYGTVNREKGTTREATSVRVAEVYFQNPDMVFLAYSRNFPDGLCGGPLAYATKAPLLLVNTKQETPAAQYVAANNITTGCVLGGTGAVPESVVNAVFS